MPEETTLERMRLLLTGRTEETKRTMVCAGKKFIEFAGKKDAYDRWDVLRYLEHMDQKKRSKNYRRFAFYSIKKVFSATESPWPFEKADVPKVGDEERIAPALPLSQKYHPMVDPEVVREEVGRLVKNAREKCNSLELAMLAVGTTYGTRRVEKARIGPDDMDRKKGILLIRTAKGGVMREHLIPESIAPYIEGYDWKHNLSPGDVTLVLGDIYSKCGLKKPARVGWHTFRRALNTCLREIAGDENAPVRLLESHIYNFLRWRAKARGEFGMMTVYDRATSFRIDQKVFSI
ncbi:unnamed protein product, partial [marine sediment metagenome]